MIGGFALELEPLEPRLLLSAPVSMSDDPDPVHEGDELTLDVVGAVDLDEARFFRSADAVFQPDPGQPDPDPQLSATYVAGTLTGWMWRGPADWAPGQWYYFAQARESGGVWSPEVTTIGTVNARPTVDSLTGGPEPTAPGEILTLTAQGVSDPDGQVAYVDFYHDANNNGVWDPQGEDFLGRDSDGQDGWTWTGEVAWQVGDYFAVATDNHGAAGSATWGAVDQKPVIEALQNDPNPLNQGQMVTFIATGVSDSDGAVDQIEFYRDVFDSGHFNPGQDELLGVATAPVGPGTWQLQVLVDWDPDVSPLYFAVAYDDDGFPGDPVWVLNQNPYLEELAASPEPVPLDGTLLLEALGVEDVDGFVAGGLGG